MSEQSEPKTSNEWTQAERDSLRKLLRMAGFLFLAIVIAGGIAAVVSSGLGTL